MGDVIICWPLKSNAEKPKVMLAVTLRAKKSTFMVTEVAFNSTMCKNGIKPPTIHPLPPLLERAGMGPGTAVVFVAEPLLGIRVAGSPAE
jgi:hypothetical protein